MNEKIEIWKPVTEYEGLYEISNLGNVKSRERMVKNSKTTTRIVRERILKPGTDTYGYLKVMLSKDGKIKTHRIHQLVAISFLNHKRNGHSIQVDHINGIKTDNRVENLEIVTARENVSRYHDNRETSSIYRGVHWYKPNQKWVAYIQINGNRKHIGYFIDEKEASQAYQKALKNINK